MYRPIILAFLMQTLLPVEVQCLLLVVTEKLWTNGQGKRGAPGSVGSVGSGDGSVSGMDVKRLKTYQCEACDKWFTSSGHLKRHFNTTLHKNAMKQKGDGSYEGLNGASFSIP